MLLLQGTPVPGGLELEPFHDLFFDSADNELWHERADYDSAINGSAAGTGGKHIPGEIGD